MTTIERLRLTVIEEVLAGTITNSTAATKLNVTVRQIQRLKKRFKVNGHDSLIHGSRGKQGRRKTDKALEDKIVQIIKEKYYDFGPTLASEKLQEFHQIFLSDETVRAIMIRHKIWKSKKRKRSQYFSWRDRRSSYGELQLFDGSYHDWFEGRNREIPEACLLASIDDATGKITNAFFGYNESIETVFSFWRSYVRLNAIPVEIYLDKFGTYKINHPKAVDNVDLMTQFGRATKTLGINLIFANTPQAKGRVERLFGTLQDRLVKEMRLANVSTIEDANLFLKSKFIPFFNHRFSVIPKSPDNCHRKIDISTANRLDSIFSKHYIRGINNDFTVRYGSKYFQLKEIQPVTVYKTDKIQIEDHFDSTIKIKYKDHYLNFFELPDKPVKVKDVPIILTEHKSHWIPPVNHPWRRFAQLIKEENQYRRQTNPLLMKDRPVGQNTDISNPISC